MQPRRGSQDRLLHFLDGTCRQEVVMAAVLLVYATRDGQTRKIAERIANALRVRRHVLELLDASRAPKDLDLSRFQAVFVGSSVHARGYLRPAVRFIQMHLRELERLPTFFFQAEDGIRDA